MRDFFIHPAQTNLELYTQAIGAGYSAGDCRLLADAYEFALRQVFPLARGSGKPFIAHLVGTASLVLASGRERHWVIAALLHALYQNRIPFQDGMAPAARRSLIQQKFGLVIDDLIHRYTDFESSELAKVSLVDVPSMADLLTLRLADELEDVSGYALALHGSEALDGSGERGSYAWRRAIKEHEGPGLQRLSLELGLTGMARGFSFWLAFHATPPKFEAMRTGWLSSVNLGEG